MRIPSTSAAKRRRPRKRHIQLDLELRHDKNGQRRGLARTKRSGRPPKVAGRPGARHKQRPPVDPRQPQHVTLRVLEDVGYLRKRHLYRGVRNALKAVAARDDYRIVHFSIQGNHLHLVCEASSSKALSSGMAGFQISAAKHLNNEITRRRCEKRRGQVFADRYHARAITSVRETRNVLNYVLNNWRHHGATGPALFDGKLDWFSSGVFFPGWKERTTPVIHVPANYEAPLVARPQTWLLAEGWKRAPAISVFEVPGKPPSPAGS